ncbi:MAG: endonuclease III domain-containing protein [Proteobacteria bacterium]|nr:endonuclease III domain-containing protein [Pseudomonadota bacterium]MBU1612496.1 endonuclease III domain-containing protein [Pseudomonadota bacterium]
MKTVTRLQRLYEAMLEALGPSHWWPGDTPFEIAVGAILTQNTNWKNVESAIQNLKQDNALDPAAILDMPPDHLGELIRPSGYFRMKANKLKNLAIFLRDEADMVIENLRDRDPQELRAKILTINGVGPETADSILNYALEMPVFVVDTYTGRIMQRHGLISEDCSYHELQNLFTDNLEPDPALFNEFHALIVRTAKDWCKKTSPRCESCHLAYDLEN